MKRSLALHAPIRRKPRDVLERLTAYADPDEGPEGPVARLEERIAALLGKERALFLPTGTMAQQVALRIHADRRGRRGFAAHPQTHLDVWEVQGYNAVHNLWFHRAGDYNSVMTREDLEALTAPLAAVIWELPQRDIGGLLPEWDDLRAQVELVRSRGAAVHMDGARLWEAQTFYRRPFDEIAGLFDTVYVSLYKALQGSRGAALAGDAATIGEATVWRQRLGGAIGDAWPLALHGLWGMDTLLPRMPEFRDHAIAIAAAITADGVARVRPDPPQTPLFHIHLPVSKSAVEQAAEEMLKEHGTHLFTRARSAPDPSRCSFEVTVGENAMEFTPDEVVRLLRELVQRAHDQG